MLFTLFPYKSRQPLLLNFSTESRLFMETPKITKIPTDTSKSHVELAIIGENMNIT